MTDINEFDDRIIDYVTVIDVSHVRDQTRENLRIWFIGGRKKKNGEPYRVSPAQKKLINEMIKGHQFYQKLTAYEESNKVTTTFDNDEEDLKSVNFISPTNKTQVQEVITEMKEWLTTKKKEVTKATKRLSATKSLKALITENAEINQIIKDRIKEVAEEEISETPEKEQIIQELRNRISQANTNEQLDKVTNDINKKRADYLPIPPFKTKAEQKRVATLLLKEAYEQRKRIRT